MPVCQSSDANPGVSTRVDLDEALAACASEPIHFAGAIQPHGALLGYDERGQVSHVSANVSEWLGLPAGEVLGRSIHDILPHLPATPSLHGELSRHEVRGRPLWMTASADGRGLLEIEAAERTSGQQPSQAFAVARALREAPDWRSAARLACTQLRAITGFNRVLLYRFDEDWSGSVEAEDGDGMLPSYLGLRFPESDLPAQVRALYLRMPLRLIPDCDATPSPILSLGGDELDLSLSVLRAVSPVHLQFMRNMGTRASLSVALVIEDRLWGLISCHSAAPHAVPPDKRQSALFLGQWLADVVALRLRDEGAPRLLMSRQHHDRLLVAMSCVSPPTPAGAADAPTDLLALTNAAGAAILLPDRVVTVGPTPDLAALNRIASFLSESSQREIFATHRLSQILPEAAAWTDRASGLLAASISTLHPSYLLWFRPEVVRTVAWAGAPEKTVSELGSLNPRHSFAVWREQVREQATPWQPHEIAAAEAFRSAVLAVVMRAAEEMAGLAGDLARANRELEAFSYSISHDLRAPFRHIAGFSEMLREHAADTLDPTGRRYLETILNSAMAAGKLVDDLLHFSHLGRTVIARHGIDMGRLVEEVRQRMEIEIKGQKIDWRIAALPRAWGDPTLLRQVMINLVANAAKYSRERNPAIIEIGGHATPEASTYFVRDNGVGFDMAYAGKMFGVFQRLHRSEDYEGTGIGLALVRRIIERHGGSIRAESELGKGACFTFSLPRSTPTA